MSKSTIIRFASGTPEVPSSSVWRIVVTKNDAYLGSSKYSMPQVKFSLHESGIWVLSAEGKSGITFEDRNRRAKRWTRPPEHVAGVTRGPSIMVPYMSLGSRHLPPGDINRRVLWQKGPEMGETIEFALYFVRPNTPTSWTERQTLLSETTLTNGDRLVLLGSTDQSPQEFQDACEQLLRNNVFRYDDPTSPAGGSFLWITTSRDSLRVPLIVDLPLLVTR